MSAASLRNPSSTAASAERRAEDEASPLLGAASADAAGSHPTKRSLLARNLYGDGRAIVTQIGCILLLVQVLWVVIPNPAGLFSYHPPLQSLALLLFAQGVLTLQPTSTKSDKERGLAFHQIFQGVALLLISAGIIIMIVNKALHGAPHFKSWHGKFGIVTGVLLLSQALIGALIAYDPGMRLLGGEGKAKALWKYHRMSGYLILPLAMVTAGLATTSADWIHAHSSATQRIVMTTGLGMITVGLLSGMHLKKLGFKRDQ